MRFLSVVFVVSLASLPAVAAEGGGVGVLREACKADVASLCPGIQPGGGRIRACLKANREKLSPGCKSAIAQMIQARRAAKAQQSTAPATQSAPPAANP
jgi:hypothetical protein